MNNTTKVLLPQWIWDNAKNNDEFKHNLSNYLKRYPSYGFIKLDGKFAVCQMSR